mmetsp:Transcript_48306/g.139947  ORF Transcript_48306/g.139947 Transcript_48306/m.139947 type:complete len:316 (+) Transcript_48306:47-994(+)
MPLPMELEAGNWRPSICSSLSLESSSAPGLLDQASPLPWRSGGQAEAAPERQPPDAGAGLASESRKVQELIESVRGQAVHIRKQAQLLSASRRCTPSTRSAHEAARTGRADGEEARRLLQGLAAAPGSSIGEQSGARLRHQKLSESLLAVFTELEASWRSFEAAEASCTAVGNTASEVVCEEQASQAAAAAGSVDLEAGRTSQRLENMESVAEAELETHAAIVDEYTEQIGVVARHVMDMRRALLDLADHTRSQGLTVDSLEHSMEQASGATSNAVEQITISSQRQHKNLKCVFWALFLVLLLAAAIAGLLHWRQ